MIGFLNTAYESVTQNYLATAMYNTVASLASNTATLLTLNVGSNLIGERISSISGRILDLNELVPRPVRDFLRIWTVGHINDPLARTLATVLPATRTFIQDVAVAPVVEELTFRFPLLLASWKIDTLFSEYFTSCFSNEDALNISATIFFLTFITTLVRFYGENDDLLARAIGLVAGMTTGLIIGRISMEICVNYSVAQLTKAALSALSSIAFTYGHDNNPTAGRAAGLFLHGLAFSALTLESAGGLLPGLDFSPLKFESTGGLMNAVVVHALHNFVCVSEAARIRSVWPWEYNDPNR